MTRPGFEPEIVLVFKRNNASLKKLFQVLSELIRLPKCHVSLLKYVLYCELHFSFFIFGFGLSDIQINCNRITDGLL
jgi:hypothetical protein